MSDRATSQAVTIHVVAPFHSRLLKEKWSHCAFTQITLKQIAIFRHLGYRVVSYSNFGSVTAAHEHVQLLGKKDFLRYFKDNGLPGNDAVIGAPGHQLWYSKLLPEIKKRVAKPGRHVVVHTYADAASGLVNDLQGDVFHLESHVGYDRPPFGAKRVFVSDAWRNWHFGKYPNEVGDRRWSWVIYPYYDVTDWPLVKDPDDYVAFMGRITADKGISTIGAIADKRPDWKFKIAGSGDVKPFQLPKNVEYVGVLAGKDRARFLGRAAVQVLPTEYLEPCAGSVIEGMLCGTPAVTSDWGGFRETILNGVTGFRASMLSEWIQGIELARAWEPMRREACSMYAQTQYSLVFAAEKYGRAVDQLLSLGDKGWYQNT